jgi:hypothetical protein
VRNVISPQKPIAVAGANPNHGGLTFAALGRMCVRASRMALLLAEHTSRNQERWA